MAPTTGASLQLAKDIVDEIRQEYYGIDASRLYVTGISLGGYGTWDTIQRWPGYFAAAVPVSGAGDPALASELRNVPIWAFHGGADCIVPPAGSREMVEAIRAKGGNPHYTEFQGADHEIWPRVYTQSELSPSSVGLFQWLFSQRKPAPAASGLPTPAARGILIGR